MTTLPASIPENTATEETGALSPISPNTAAATASASSSGSSQVIRRTSILGTFQQGSFNPQKVASQANVSGGTSEPINATKTVEVSKDLQAIAEDVAVSNKIISSEEETDISSAGNSAKVRRTSAKSTASTTTGISFADFIAPKIHNPTTTPAPQMAPEAPKIPPTVVGTSSQSTSPPPERLPMKRKSLNSPSSAPTTSASTAAAISAPAPVAVTAAARTRSSVSSSSPATAAAASKSRANTTPSPQKPTRAPLISPRSSVSSSRPASASAASAIAPTASTQSPRVTVSRQNSVPNAITSPHRVSVPNTMLRPSISKRPSSAAPLAVASKESKQTPTKSPESLLVRNKSISTPTPPRAVVKVSAPDQSISETKKSEGTPKATSKDLDAEQISVPRSAELDFLNSSGDSSNLNSLLMHARESDLLTGIPSTAFETSLNVAHLANTIALRQDVPAHAKSESSQSGESKLTTPTKRRFLPSVEDLPIQNTSQYSAISDSSSSSFTTPPRPPNTLLVYPGAPHATLQESQEIMRRLFESDSRDQHDISNEVPPWDNTNANDNEFRWVAPLHGQTQLAKQAALRQNKSKSLHGYNDSDDGDLDDDDVPLIDDFAEIKNRASQSLQSAATSRSQSPDQALDPLYSPPTRKSSLSNWKSQQVPQNQQPQPVHHHHQHHHNQQQQQQHQQQQKQNTPPKQQSVSSQSQTKVKNQVEILNGIASATEQRRLSKVGKLENPMYSHVASKVDCRRPSCQKVTTSPQSSGQDYASGNTLAMEQSVINNLKGRPSISLKASPDAVSPQRARAFSFKSGTLFGSKSEAARAAFHVLSPAQSTASSKNSISFLDDDAGCGLASHSAAGSKSEPALQKASMATLSRRRSTITPQHSISSSIGSRSPSLSPLPSSESFTAPRALSFSFRGRSESPFSDQFTSVRSKVDSWRHEDENGEVREAAARSPHLPPILRRRSSSITQDSDRRLAAAAASAAAAAVSTRMSHPEYVGDRNRESWHRFATDAIYVGVVCFLGYLVFQFFVDNQGYATPY